MISTRNNSVTHAAQKMKEGAVAMKDAAYQKGSEALEYAAEQTDEFVQNRPYETALIAFGIGMLCGTCLGMFISRAK